MESRLERTKRWQSDMRAQGKCTTCAKPAAPFTRCPECRKKRAIYNQRYNLRYKL